MVKRWSVEGNILKSSVQMIDGEKFTRVEELEITRVRGGEDLNETQDEATAEDFAALSIEETQYEDLEELLKKLRVVYDEREAIRKRDKEITAEYEALNRNAVRLYNSRGITQQKLAGVGTFFIRATVMPTVKDNERLVEWLDDVGDGGLAVRNVHPSRLKSYMNERLKNGLELPNEEIMETFTKESISIRRAK